jgi:hypothetical protein
MPTRLTTLAAALLLAVPAAAEGPRNAAFSPTPEARTAIPKTDAKGELACPGDLPVLTGFRLKNGRRALLCAVAGDAGALAAAHPHVPRGWRQAWEDGRLNPLRGAPTTP